MEVAWGNLLTEVMGVSAIKAIRIHDETVWEATEVADKVLYPFGSMVLIVQKHGLRDD